MLKGFVSDEKGRILAWTLVLLGVGALLIPPLLTRISTNLIACRAVEESLEEQYAADSGVEYALWQLQNGITAGQGNYTLNGKAVEVTWGQYITDTYKITSKATGHSDGSNTRIESYVSLEVVEPPDLLASSSASSMDSMAPSDSEASAATVEMHIRTYQIYP
jgi:hypothetical protein